MPERNVGGIGWCTEVIMTDSLRNRIFTKSSETDSMSFGSRKNAKGFMPFIKF